MVALTCNRFSSMAANTVKSLANKLFWEAVLQLGLLHYYYSHILGAVAQQVPCCFIFGDSLADNGSNNQLLSLARANIPPYGIHFPAGPSGRFSNGKTTVDIITELLGFDDYIPPYAAAAAATGEDVLKGVNYASAAAGIREETGSHLGERVSFSGQVRNHQDTVSRIVELMGSGDEAAAAANKYLSRCIYSFGLGSNDYLNNYFQPLFYATGLQFTPEKYAEDLIQMYTSQLQVMYEYGARKFVLIGVGPIGCIPSELTTYKSSLEGRSTNCVESINSANQIFNEKLRSLVEGLNRNMSDAKFVYINAYGIFQDLIDNPGAHGFVATNEACCGVGRNKGQITCLAFQNPCENRSQYLFWDAFHPTEAANRVVGRRCYNAHSPSDSYPFDIHRLAQL